MCQCPSSGFYHFYRDGNFIYTSDNWVSALHRASPISTAKTKKGGLCEWVCQCPTSGFTHFYGTPPKPTIFQYVPSPNLHMFLKSVYFFSFLGSFLVFSTFFQNYSQNHICIIPNLKTICKKKFFPPFIFEPYHRYTICNPIKHIVHQT